MEILAPKKLRKIILCVCLGTFKTGKLGRATDGDLGIEQPVILWMR